MQYFFNNWYTKQLIVSTTLVLFWWQKLVPKQFVKKMEYNSMLEKVLLVCNRNIELLRLVGATFVSKVAFLRRMKKKNLIILKSLPEKSLLFFCFICLTLLTFELSNISWKCLESCNILTERTYDRAVFKIFLNQYYWTICIFIEQ